MSFELFPVVQWFDNSGLPLSGGLISTFIAGTNTPQATYTDSTGGTPQSNPVVLDSAGRAQIWFAAASYKLVLKTAAGVTLMTIDNVTLDNLAATISSLSMTGALTMQQPTAATSGANQGSNVYSLQGTFWNGSASGTDTWQIQSVIGAGTNPTSTLTITHSGSPGTATVSIPEAAISFGGAVTLSGANVISAKNLEQVRFADQFSGADILAKVAAAYSDLPSTGGVIIVPGGLGTLSASTQLTLSTKPVHIHIDCGTIINWTGGAVPVVVINGLNTSITFTGCTQNGNYYNGTLNGSGFKNAVVGSNTFQVTNTQNVTIQGLDFDGGASLTDAHIALDGGSALSTNATSRIGIYGNRFIGKLNAVSGVNILFQIYIGAQNGSNMMTGQGGNAIDINANSGFSVGDTSIYIENNWIRGSVGNGIKLIGVQGIVNGVVRNNQVSNISTNGIAGMVITAQGCAVENNDIESITGTGTSNAMILSGGSFTISGNTIFDCRVADGTGAIKGSTLTNSWIGPNRILKGSSAGTAAISLDGTSLTTDVMEQQTDYTNALLRNGVIITVPFIASPTLSSPVITATNLTLASSGNTVTLLNVQNNLAPVVGTGADANIFTWAIPAAIIASGKAVHIKFLFSHSTGTASVTYKFKIGATTISGFGASTATGTFGGGITLYNQGGGLCAKIDDALILAGGTVQSGPGYTAGVTGDFSAGFTVNLTFSVAATDQVTPQFWLAELVQ